MAPSKGKSRKGNTMAKGKKGKQGKGGKSAKSCCTETHAPSQCPNAMLPGDAFLRKSMFLDPWEKLYAIGADLAARLQNEVVNEPEPWATSSNPTGTISKSAPPTPRAALPMSDADDEIAPFSGPYQQDASAPDECHTPEFNENTPLSPSRDSVESLDHGDFGRQSDEAPTSSLLMKLRALPKARGMTLLPRKLPDVPLFSDATESERDLSKGVNAFLERKLLDKPDEPFSGETSSLSMKLRTLPKAKSGRPTEDAPDLRAVSKALGGFPNLATETACAPLPMRAISKASATLPADKNDGNSIGPVILKTIAISKSCHVTSSRIDAESKHRVVFESQNVDDSKDAESPKQPLTLRPRKDLEAITRDQGEVETSVGDIDVQLDSLLEEVEKNLDDKPVSPIVLKPRVAVCSPAKLDDLAVADDLVDPYKGHDLVDENLAVAVDDLLEQPSRPLKLRPRRELDPPTISASSEPPTKRIRGDACLLPESAEAPVADSMSPVSADPYLSPASVAYMDEPDELKPDEVEPDELEPDELELDEDEDPGEKEEDVIALALGLAKSRTVERPPEVIELGAELELDASDQEMENGEDISVRPELELDCEDVQSEFDDCEDICVRPELDDVEDISVRPELELDMEDELELDEDGAEQEIEFDM